jgi:uncharacterized protein YecT (DUF1311 family)
MISHRPFLASGAALLALLVPHAAAYEYPPIDAEVAASVEACVLGAVEQSSDGAACIGLVFDACEGNAGTTYSMSACFLQEHDFWQSMIVRTFQVVSEEYRSSDRRSVLEEPLSESLSKAQAAWSAYAEAQCQFAYDKFGAGSIRNIEAAACKRDLAAERAIFLRVLSAEG